MMRKDGQLLHSGQIRAPKNQSIELREALHAAKQLTAPAR